MRVFRIPISHDELEGTQVTFSSRNSQYLRNVLRLKPGKHVRILINGSEYVVQISASARGDVTGHVVATVQGTQDSSSKIVLAFSCVRPGPVEQILRHGTEVGVSHFVPLITVRSYRRPLDLKPRWKFIVESATTQSGRTSVPSVECPLPFDRFLKCYSGSGTKIVLSVSSTAKPIFAILKDQLLSEVIIVVGPEGGLEATEESGALEHGFVAVSLGPRLLRTETAALLAAGIVVNWQEWPSGSIG